MPGLGETLFDLTQMRRAREGSPQPAPSSPVLVAMTPSGRNPGGLRVRTYVPPGLPPGAPLVVVLHGCAQTAAGYDHGAGWSTLAERHGFALLFPEQDGGNNPNLCFNWFQQEDVTRGRGEALSICEMIGQMLATYKLGPSRVYINGLSAGGAMTAAMLACYPELFAGGAIIAGLPYGAASGVQQAMEAMHSLRSRTPREWGDLVRAASPHRGVWPPVQVWHGGADGTVRHGASEELLKQWADVHGVQEPAFSDQVDGARHQVWIGGGGAGRARKLFHRWPGARDAAAHRGRGPGPGDRVRGAAHDRGRHQLDLADRTLVGAADASRAPPSCRAAGSGPDRLGHHTARCVSARWSKAWR